MLPAYELPARPVGWLAHGRDAGAHPAAASAGGFVLSAAAAQKHFGEDVVELARAGAALGEPKLFHA